MANRSDQFLRQAQDFAARLGDHKTVLVTTHIAPDGDSIASVLAAALLIDFLGSRSICAIDGVVLSRFQFLPGSDRIVPPERLGAILPETPIHAALVLDCGSLERIGNLAELMPSKNALVNIDHHPDNRIFADLNIVYPHASSTTEILFDLAILLKCPLSRDLATLLYAGLMSDTGGFRYSNTTEKTLRTAAQMIAAGANPAQVAAAVYRANSAAGLKRLGEALDSLELEANGRIALMTLQGLNHQDEYEDTVDFAMTVQGVQVAALFRVGEGTCRVSLRAGDGHDVAHIARRFGGGGHQKAAGFTHQGALSEIRAQLLDLLRQEVADQPAALANER
jgi:phosphoesterase RecJ-like protein